MLRSRYPTVLKAYLSAVLLAALTVVSGATTTLAAPPASTSSAKHEPFRRRFENAQPWWGIQISGSPGCLLDCASSVGPAKAAFNPLSLNVDFQPLHTFGVLGIGAEAAYQFSSQLSGPVGSEGYPKYVLSEGFLVGGRVIYQMKYGQRQWLVPVGFYQLYNMSYSLKSGEKGYFLAQGPGAGLWIFLSAIESDTAQRVYKFTNISRFYLTLEGRSIRGGDSIISAQGTNAQLGLRVEL